MQFMNYTNNTFFCMLKAHPRLLIQSVILNLQPWNKRITSAVGKRWETSSNIQFPEVGPPDRLKESPGLSIVIF